MGELTHIKEYIGKLMGKVEEKRRIGMYIEDVYKGILFGFTGDKYLYECVSVDKDIQAVTAKKQGKAARNTDQT